MQRSLNRELMLSKFEQSISSVKATKSHSWSENKNQVVADISLGYENHTIRHD